MGKKYLSENIYAHHLMGDPFMLIVYAGLFEKKRFFWTVIGKNTAAVYSFYRPVFLSLRGEW